MTQLNPDITVRNLDTYYQRIIGRLIVADEKSSGTNGGTFTLGAWRTRDLNTVRLNTLNGSSLAANQITLPRGVYVARGSAPGYFVVFHKTRLYNVTDGATLVRGTSELANQNVGGEDQTRSFILGLFALSGTKAIELQHQSSATQVNTGFGIPGSLDTEVYSILEILKIG